MNKAKRTTHIIPLRFRAADAFLASARDIADAAAIKAAIEIYWHVRFPCTRPATETSLAVYAEWKTANGW